MELFSTDKLRRVFESEIDAAGGRVKDVFDDGRRLFMRSVLPGIREVQPNDRMQGGVAMRFTGELTISPYVFREVCENGAIWAHSLESTRIAVDSEGTERKVREAVRACSAPEVFDGNVTEIRRSLHTPADRSIMMMPALSAMAKNGNHRIVAEIIDMFLEDQQRTGFALMNAVTAAARDVEDPELRWDLEECGGGIPALLSTCHTLEGGATKRLEDELMDRILQDDERFTADSGIRDLAAVA